MRDREVREILEIEILDWAEFRRLPRVSFGTAARFPRMIGDVRLAAVAGKAGIEIADKLLLLLCILLLRALDVELYA